MQHLPSPAFALEGQHEWGGCCVLVGAVSWYRAQHFMGKKDHYWDPTGFQAGPRQPLVLSHWSVSLHKEQQCRLSDAACLSSCTAMLGAGLVLAPRVSRGFGRVPMVT